jgi:hypothetical protein
MLGKKRKREEEPEKHDSVLKMMTCLSVNSEKPQEAECRRRLVVFFYADLIELILKYAHEVELVNLKQFFVEPADQKKTKSFALCCLGGDELVAASIYDSTRLQVLHASNGRLLRELEIGGNGVRLQLTAFQDDIIALRGLGWIDVFSGNDGTLKRGIEGKNLISNKEVGLGPQCIAAGAAGIYAVLKPRREENEFTIKLFSHEDGRLLRTYSVPHNRSYLDHVACAYLEEDDLLWLGYVDGEVRVLNCVTGALLPLAWKYWGHIFSIVAHGEQVFLVAGYNKALTVHDRHTGTLLAKFTHAELDPLCLAMNRRGDLFVTNQDGVVSFQ